MKKLLAIVVLGLLWCNVAFTKPVLLECVDDNPPDPDEISYDYLSLDLEKKDFLYVAYKTVAKNCSLGNCEKLRIDNLELPLIYDDPSYLSIGQEDSNQFTINKKDLSMTWASYYWWEIGTTNTFKQVNTLYYHSCRKINKFPF